MLEAECREGADILICRGSMEKNDTFANAVKVLNRCLENKVFENSEDIKTSAQLSTARYSYIEQVIKKAKCKVFNYICCKNHIFVL